MPQSNLSTMVGCSDGHHVRLQTLLPRSSSAEWVAAPTKAIKLIDYEYSGVNAVAYDIANHWCGLFGMVRTACIRRRGWGLGSGSGLSLGLTRARPPASGLAAVRDVCKHGRCTVRPCAAALRRRQQPKPSVTLIFCRCEYAADYDTATPHVLDFSKMPSPARQVTAQCVLTGPSRPTCCWGRAAKQRLSHCTVYREDMIHPRRCRVDDSSGVVVPCRQTSWTHMWRRCKQSTAVWRQRATRWMWWRGKCWKHRYGCLDRKS